MVMYMAKEFAKAFYKSAAWRKCRQAYVKSVNGLCETCLNKGKIVPGKILHHIKELTPVNISDPYIALGWDNLKFECQECHNREHHEKYGVTADGLMFDEKGDLVRNVHSPPLK